MKNLSLILLALVFVACEGPMGPPGEPGPAGDNFIGQAFEIVDANFNESNGYGQVFEFPANAEVFDTDIVLVYWLYPFDQGTDDDVWQPLPASVFFEDGSEMQYAFDHTVFDVQLFLQGDLDLSTVGDGYTQEQIFKVVILPVDYVEENKVNLNNMKEVMKAVDESKVKRLKSNSQ